MLKAGVPVGAGTDATRVASYNPWVSLNWLVTGKTVGGTRLYPLANRLDREEALRLWTTANTWFSNEEGKKGQIAVGQLADLAVLADDYMTVPEDEIPHLSSVLTLLGGKVVHGEGDYSKLAPCCPRRCPTGRRCAPSAATRIAREVTLAPWPAPAAAPAAATSMATTMPPSWVARRRPPMRARSGARLAAAAGRSDPCPSIIRKNPHETFSGLDRRWPARAGPDRGACLGG
jgi:hypothetical protein